MIYLVQAYNYLTTFIFRLYHYVLLPLRYKIKVVGGEKISIVKTDPKGGFLFLSNHPSHLDASIIGTELMRLGHQVSVWTMDFVFKNPYTKIVSRNSDSIRLLKVPNVHETRNTKHPTKVKHLIRKTVEKLQAGENILFFPAGCQKHTPHEEINGKSAIEKILKQYPNANIVLIRVKGLWGSRFSKGVCRDERSNLKNGNWIYFIWSIFKILILNLVFFIPKRNIIIEFENVSDKFPRQGSRKEMNEFLESWFNHGYGIAGEPLLKVPNYFWKASYLKNEYNLKFYEYDLSKIPLEVLTDIKKAILKEKQMSPETINENSLFDRDLSLDSLEITNILLELEKKYKMPRLVPKQITTVGHLAAIVSKIPIRYVPIKGSFPEVKEIPASCVKAWHVVATLVASIFSFLDSPR